MKTLIPPQDTVRNESFDFITDQVIVPALTFQFKSFSIYPRQIGQFRGAVVELAQQNNWLEMAGVSPELFHNHTNEDKGVTTHNRYPLIQYKVISRKAAIVGLGEGARALQLLAMELPPTITMGGRQWETGKVSVQQENVLVGLNPQQRHYRLYKWLPLNQENYQKWRQADGMVERVKLLEHVLVGHILSLLNGVGVQPEEQVVATLTDISKRETLRYKNRKLLALDVEFRANVDLPPQAGLGRTPSHGFGKLLPLADSNEDVR